MIFILSACELRVDIITHATQHYSKEKCHSRPTSNRFLQPQCFVITLSFHMFRSLFIPQTLTGRISGEVFFLKENLLLLLCFLHFESIETTHLHMHTGAVLHCGSLIGRQQKGEEVRLTGLSGGVNS